MFGQGKGQLEKEEEEACSTFVLPACNNKYVHIYYKIGALVRRRNGIES
jgi:hypothetical protein